MADDMGMEFAGGTAVVVIAWTGPAEGKTGARSVIVPRPGRVTVDEPGVNVVDLRNEGPGSVIVSSPARGEVWLLFTGSRLQAELGPTVDLLAEAPASMADGDRPASEPGRWVTATGAHAGVTLSAPPLRAAVYDLPFGASWAIVDDAGGAIVASGVADDRVNAVAAVERALAERRLEAWDPVDG